MNTKLSEQSLLDKKENITILEEEMNLSSDNILTRLNEKVAAHKKVSLRKRVAYVGMAACLALIVVGNSKSIYSMASNLFAKYTVKTQNAVLLEENMRPIEVKSPGKLDAYGTYVGGKGYSSLKECADALGIHILSSDMAWQETHPDKVSLTYPLVANWVMIDDPYYIVGDIKDLKWQAGNSVVYSNPHGKYKYATPISYRVEFFIKGTKRQSAGVDDKNSNLTHIETYKSAQGYKVQILSGSSNPGTIGTYVAYFIDKNIRYTLEGTLDIQELKKIIDSLH